MGCLVHYCRLLQFFLPLVCNVVLRYGVIFSHCRGLEVVANLTADTYKPVLVLTVREAREAVREAKEAERDAVQGGKEAQEGGREASVDARVRSLPSPQVIQVKLLLHHRKRRGIIWQEVLANSCSTRIIYHF